MWELTPQSVRRWLFLERTFSCSAAIRSLVMTARARLFVLMLSAGFLWGQPATALDCAVPGTLPDVASALAEPSCSQIILAQHTFAESVVVDRTVTISVQGGGLAILQGNLVVTQGTLRLVGVTMQNGCPTGAVHIEEGAQMIPQEDVQIQWSLEFPCPEPVVPALQIFKDDFESGGLNAWSASQP